ncbi:MAG: hypothetical protein EOP06_16280, partial [Proteobacteria bacterium]
MKFVHYSLPVFLFTMSALFSSCKTLSLARDETRLLCGDNPPSQSNYIMILGPEEQSIKKDSLEVFDISQDYQRTNLVSSNGCLVIPPEGRYLVRSKEKEWAVLVDSGQIQRTDSIKLENFSNELITISCDEKNVVSVSPDFSIQDILIDEVSPDFKSAFRIDYTVNSLASGRESAIDQSIALLNKNKHVFTLLQNEQVFEVKLIVRNLLKTTVSAPKVCKFRVDATPPFAQLALNASTDFSTINHHNSPLKIIRNEDVLSFQSTDSDLDSVSFCHVKLDDDFLEGDLAKKAIWNRDSRALNCEGVEEKITTAKNSIMNESKSGFWSIRYRSKDRLGNFSSWRSEIVFFKHQSQ